MVKTKKQNTILIKPEVRKGEHVSLIFPEIKNIVNIYIILWQIYTNNKQFVILEYFSESLTYSIIWFMWFTNWHTFLMARFLFQSNYQPIRQRTRLQWWFTTNTSGWSVLNLVLIIINLFLHMYIERWWIKKQNKSKWSKSQILTRRYSLIKWQLPVYDFRNLFKCSSHIEESPKTSQSYEQKVVAISSNFRRGERGDLDHCSTQIIINNMIYL